MGKLIKKLLLLILPLAVISACYIITDPFQNMPFHQQHEFDILMLSRGDISTTAYLKNVDTYQYNSFILGSSRSTAHTAAEWAKYLPAGSVPFSFNAWNESVEGVYRRVKLIDSLKKPIDNAFIIIDIDRAFEIGPITWDHYLITGVSKRAYYLNNYYLYLQNPSLVLTSVDYKLFHKRRAYMDGFIGQQKGDYNPITNDWDINSERKILADSVNYYQTSAGNFYNRPAVQRFSVPLINASSQTYLHKIAAILARRQTNYKVIIAPLYSQLKINPRDYALLNQILGAKNVYDYSGINPITANKFNYCADVVHYRKKVGNLIFKQVYSK